MPGNPIIHIYLEGDGAFKDVDTSKIAHHGSEMSLAALSEGMESGDPSVMFRVDTKFGHVLVQSSLKALLTAVDALKARYGDPRT
jgi:hypothetical protein